MSTKRKIRKETENGESRLREKYGNSSPFTAPAGYFEGLPAQILNKITSGEHESKHSKSIWSLRPALAAAATVVILAGIAALMLLMRPKPSEEAMDDFTYLEFYEYNFSSLAELEETYILSMTSEDTDPDIFTLPVDTAGISQEDLIEYLLAENHIEYLTINNNQQ